MDDYDVDHVHKQVRTQTPVGLMFNSIVFLLLCVIVQQTDVYYGLLLATRTSRFHVVSVPVDVGVRHATEPQDMAVQHWLYFGLQGTQRVVDLDINFEPLISNNSDEDVVYTLAVESQVRLPTVASPMRSDSHLFLVATSHFRISQIQ
jgi:hypothetical protein